MSRLAGSIVLVSLIAGAGCSHTVEIKSIPEGATVFVDGQDRGKAPVLLEEDAGFFDERKLRVELEGYTPLETTLVQTEPIWPVIVPAICGVPFTLGGSCLLLQWSTQYAQEYNYRLSPVLKDGENPPTAAEREAAQQRDDNATIPY